VTVGGGPVGVPLPIGGPSAILGSSMTGPDPPLFSEAEKGWEEGGTRVTARSRLSIGFLGKEVPKGSPVIGRHIATATSGAHLPSLVKQRGGGEGPVNRCLLSKME
jgi:hypothetical protein